MSARHNGTPVAVAGSMTCPLPVEDEAVVQLAHGGGGRKTASLIDAIFVPAFRNDTLSQLGDGAIVGFGGERLAFSTDSYVVAPIFFPGGNIGSLAIHGTANDLAMCGAVPLGFSVALIIEEGLAMSDLRRIVASIAEAGRQAGAPVITGDTKVVDRGRGDGIYINTSGFGRVRDGIHVGPAQARPGDVVLVSGPVGDHGIAVMASRSGIDLRGGLISDSAPVGRLVGALLTAVPDTRVLRDPTRGGLATALCEIAAASAVTVVLSERAVPVREEVSGACELLGLDPLYVACEGRFLAIVPRDHAELALSAMRSLPEGRHAAVIGEVTDADPGRVLLRTAVGSHRRLERLSGEQLPRIC